MPRPEDDARYSGVGFMRCPSLAELTKDAPDVPFTLSGDHPLQPRQHPFDRPARMFGEALIVAATIACCGAMVVLQAGAGHAANIVGSPAERTGKAEPEHSQTGAARWP